MSLDWGRKLQYLEETLTPMENKLHTHTEEAGFTTGVIGTGDPVH